MAKISHGKSIVNLNENIIEVTCIGSFNHQGVNEYESKVKDAVMSLNNSDFAMLIDNLLFEGGTPEAFNELDLYNNWLNTQKIVAKAFVINNVVTKSILVRRTPALKEQTVNFFEDKVEARAWLASQLHNSKMFKDKLRALCIPSINSQQGVNMS